MAENTKEMENPEEVKPHSAFLEDFRAIHQKLGTLKAPWDIETGASLAYYQHVGS